MFTRRQMLAMTASVGAMALVPHARGQSNGVKTYELVAAKGLHHLGTENQPATNLWLYNGQSPGPLLTVNKGEELAVTFVNNLPQPSAVHWHGLRIANAMDGVPGLTQPAVQPGERFTYRFTPKDAGAFWYHAHAQSWEQVSRGLYGPLVVLDDNETLNRRDFVLVLDDWRLGEDFQIDTQSFRSLHDWSHAGRLGNWLTINGQSQPEITLPGEGRVRLRLLNASNARTLKLGLEAGATFEIVALDGAPCPPFERASLQIAPAQRVDIIVDVKKAFGALQEISTGKPIEIAKFSHTSEATVDGLNVPKPPHRHVMPPQKEARVVDIHMQGGAMGNLAEAKFQGEIHTLRQLATKHAKLWAFNGEVGGLTRTLADVKLGDVVVLRIWNDTNWLHAMHLHGHHFWVSSKEFGEQEKTVLRDTYLMVPGERSELVFVADNPGKWLFHCHMLEHHAAGMGGVITVS